MYETTCVCGGALQIDGCPRGPFALLIQELGLLLRYNITGSCMQFPHDFYSACPPTN